MNKYVLITVCIMLCSCREAKITEDFFGNEHMLHGKTVDIDCLIGRPTEIVCIDSLLMFCDYYETQVITVLDVKNNKFVRRFLNTGQGPEDVLRPLKLSVTGNRLNVFQIQNARLYEYDAKDIVDTTRTQAVRKRQFDDRPANIGITSNGFVGIGLYEHGRYKLYDENGKTHTSVGVYPFRGEKMKPDERFFIYQGVICAKPGGNCFAMGTNYCDNLEFYRIEKDGASPVKKYETHDVKGHYERMIVLDEGCVMSYKAASGTDKYCYMLYSGQQLGERHVRTTGGKKIIVFDWDGDYIKTFELDKTAFSFCVDKTDSVLFAITNDEEEGFLITRYDIK